MTVTADTRHLVWIAPISWDGIPGTDRAMATAVVILTTRPLTSIIGPRR